MSVRWMAYRHALEFFLLTVHVLFQDGVLSFDEFSELATNLKDQYPQFAIYAATMRVRPFPLFHVEVRSRATEFCFIS